MANLSQTINHCHQGKQTTLFGPRTVDWNPTNATRATSHPFLATKTLNADQTDDIITTDVNRHDTVDFGHETSLQVPRPPPQPPPLPWPALPSQHRVSQLIADWNPTNATWAISHPLATKTLNADQTDDIITTDVNRHDTVDFGHKSPEFV